MKKLMLLLMLTATAQADAEGDYRPMKDYACLLYNILAEYSSAHPDCSIEGMTKYLRSGATEIVFKDAQAMGYGRWLLIRVTYAIAMAQQPQDLKILGALKYELSVFLLWREVFMWGVVSCTLFTLTASFALTYVTAKMYREFLRA